MIAGNSPNADKSVTHRLSTSLRRQHRRPHWVHMFAPVRSQHSTVPVVQVRTGGCRQGQHRRSTYILVYHALSEPHFVEIHPDSDIEIILFNQRIGVGLTMQTTRNRG